MFSTTYCEFFSLPCFGSPSVFQPTNQKQLSAIAGFNIDDITQVFTLAGNVFQHNLPLSALSHNRFFPWPLPLHCPSFIRISRPPSMTALPRAFPAHAVKPRHTDRTKPLSAAELMVNARVSACERSKPTPLVLICL